MPSPAKCSDLAENAVLATQPFLDDENRVQEWDEDTSVAVGHQNDQAVEKLPGAKPQLRK
jgi:hypothetical protein